MPVAISQRKVIITFQMEKSYEFYHLHNMLNVAVSRKFLISLIVCTEQFLFRETNEEGTCFMNLGRHFELLCMVCIHADPAMSLSHRHISKSHLHLVRVH